MEPYLSGMQARMEHEARLRRAADRRLVRRADRRPAGYRRLAVLARRWFRGAAGAPGGVPPRPVTAPEGAPAPAATTPASAPTPVRAGERSVEARCC